MSGPTLTGSWDLIFDDNLNAVQLGFLCHKASVLGCTTRLLADTKTVRFVGALFDVQQLKQQLMEGFAAEDEDVVSSSTLSTPPNHGSDRATS